MTISRVQTILRSTSGILLLAAAAALGGCATGREEWGPLFYPPPPQRPRIQYLTKFVEAADVEGRSSFLMTFLVGETSSRRRLRKPTAVVAHEGVIYVADPGWDTVLILDLKERVFDTIGDRGDGKLRVPVAVTLDAEANKFVVDTGRNQVVQFNSKNEFVRAFGDPDALLPSGVAVDEKFLYVTNRREARVEVLNRRTKKQVRTIGRFGKEEGEFNAPTSLTLDARGHLFVTDGANFRIQEFGPDGKYVKSFGLLGDGPGTFARPKGTAIDGDGHLYTVDAAFENVQVWDVDSAEVLLAFGGPGVEPGSMYLPSDVHISYELVPYFEDLVDPGFDLQYVILVANNYGPNKLLVYGFVDPKDPSRYVDPSESDEESDPSKD